MIMNRQIYSMGILDPSSKSTSELDTFILCSGSDNRAYQILESINSKKTKIIMLNFQERINRKENSNPIFSYKKKSLENLTEVSCKIKIPNSILETFTNIGFDDSSKIGIDISCLTKPYFYYLIKLFKERFKLAKLTIFYTEPKSYFFQKGLFNAFHSSTGPLSIIEIPGYSGQELRGAKRKLVILLGFDGDLSKEIREDVSPEETVLVNGFPSYTPKFKDISLIVNEKLVSGNDISVAYARANNPFEVYNLLESIKTENEASGQEIFLNIAPLGTKPMALGACLFALHNPEVRVVYPLPEEYDDKYSEQCWNSWVYKLPLSV